jgi:hypothetical protein
MGRTIQAWIVFFQSLYCFAWQRLQASEPAYNLPVWGSFDGPGAIRAADASAIHTKESDTATTVTNNARFFMDPSVVVDPSDIRV